MSSSSRPTPRSNRGGIQVRSVRRAPTSNAGASSRNTHRKSQPSARYRKVLRGKKAVGHGGDFVKDDEAGRQFENRVLEVYAPAATVNETVREIPLRSRARLEGSAFRLPKLSDMCLEVISNNFDAHVLPLQYKHSTTSQEQRSIAQAKRPKGILGIPSAAYDEERDGDFVPSSDEERSGRKSNPRKRLGSKRSIPTQMSSAEQMRELELVQEFNAFDLDILPPKLTLSLQQLLERKAPKLLTFEVLRTYFLSRQKVKDSRTFRVLAIVGGIHVDDVVRLYGSLLAASRQPSALVPSTIEQLNPISTLTTLHLQAFTRLTSRQLEALFTEAISLENVCLRGCVNVTSDAMKALIRSCGVKLLKVNMNWTSIGLNGVECIIRGAPNLRELKIAHVRGLNDGSVPTMMNRITQETVQNGTVPLGKLERLKLHGTQVGMTSVGSLLKHCGTQLQMLDVGATHFGGPGCIEMLLIALGYDQELIKDSGAAQSTNAESKTRASCTSLRKVNFSRLDIPEMDLMHFAVAIRHLPNLRSINLNFIQNTKGGSASGLSSTLLAILFTSVAQRAAAEIADAGQSGQRTAAYTFDRLGLAASSATTRPLLPCIFNIPLPVFCHQDQSSTLSIFPPPKIVRLLDLSGLDLSKQNAEPYSVLAKLPNGRHADLLTFYDPTSHVPVDVVALNVEEVQLSGCKLPEQVPWERLGVAGRLRAIDLSGTAVGLESIERLIHTNECLAKMDLTGCRSIPVRQRRNYFSSRTEHHTE